MIVRVAVAVLVLSCAAHACSCITIPPSEALAKADVVFRGTVVEIHEAERDTLSKLLLPPKRIAVFRVNRVWKGNIGEEFEIPLPSKPTGLPPYTVVFTCTDYEKLFAVGNEVLIYARWSATSGEYTTSICDRTALIQNAAPDLREPRPVLGSN